MSSPSAPTPSRSSSRSDGFVHLHVHTEYSMLDGAARIDDLCAEARHANLARKNVHLGEASSHIGGARTMHAVEIGDIDGVLVHQPEKTDAQPRQKHPDSTARAAAAHDTDPQPPNDRIEPATEERGLPRQDLIFVSRNMRARDLDLATYQRDR